jgi:hypothetical protein
MGGRRRSSALRYGAPLLWGLTRQRTWPRGSPAAAGVVGSSCLPDLLPVQSYFSDLANTKGIFLCRRSFVFMRLAMLAY